jgi:hypothetical protein
LRSLRLKLFICNLGSSFSTLASACSVMADYKLPAGRILVPDDLPTAG